MLIRNNNEHSFNISAANRHENNEKAIENSSTTCDGDVIHNVIGNFGIWQLRTILIVFLCKIPSSWFMACIMFTAPELYASNEFSCKRNITHQNVTQDQCFIYTNTSDKIPCREFQYFSNFQSLIMQFDLVCARDIFIAWTQYWHLFGVLLGGITATKMMIFISPRRVYSIGMLALLVCGVLTGYARDFSLHCAFRCLSAVCCAIMFTAGQAIFVDITGGAQRIGAVILYDTFWSIGLFLLPTLATLFNTWTGIYMGITIPTLLLLLLLLWTPDSPRWLLKHSQSPADIYHVEQLVRTAAAINERSFIVPENLHEQLEELSEMLKKQAAPVSWTQLWSGYRAKIHMLASHIALAAFIINFMGMLLNIRSFGRDFIVPNTLAMGFAEILGCFLALHLTLKHNKWKWQWAGLFNIVAGAIGCLGWFLSGNQSVDDTLKVVLWMVIATIPKTAVSCAQSMILACMSELVPSNKKISFVFSVVTWARVWLLCAPFLNVLKVYDTALSLTAYCCLSILGGFCTCLLLTPPCGKSTPQATYTLKQKSLLGTAVWSTEDDVHITHL